MNNKYPVSHIELFPHTYRISQYNTLEAYRATCELFENRAIALFGPNSVESSPFIQSLCDSKEIPHIEIHRSLNLERNDTLVNFYPHPKVLSFFFMDLIEAFNWKKVIIIYDNDESLLSVSSLLDFNNRRGRKVLLKQLHSAGSKGNYRQMLSEVKALGETRFVLTCSTDILENVLKQLQQVGMMTEIYSYLITDLDMQTIDLEPFRYGGTNITGIRMVDPEQTDVKQIALIVQPHGDGHKVRVETALIIDAVTLFYETLYDLTIDQKKILKALPLNCKSTNSWNDGYTIINLMKSKSTQGITGLVQFDVEGFRRDFKIDVLELFPDGLLKIGEWNSSVRNVHLNRPDRVKYGSGKPGDNIFNRTFTVLISITPPYGMLKETTTQLNGNDRYEGFGVDVIHELSKILGFNYTFVLQEDGLYGNYNKTSGEWNGMLREIIDGRADLAITDLTVTSERENAVDFTMPFMNLGISILYRKPEPVPPSLFMFVSPFSFYVWILLAVSYFVVSISFFVMGRLSPTEWQNPFPCVEEPEYLVNQFTVRNSLWFTVGALMQQGSELAPVAISTRTASGVWWFFVLVMVSSYTANLAAFLTVTTLVTPFKDIEELAAQEEIKFGAKKGGATAHYFRDSNLSKYQKVWSYMVHHPELMMDDNDAGVTKVEKENYAFLMESTTIEYNTERHCSLARVGGLLDDKGYGIAMRRNSQYRNDLSTAVLQLQEKGILTGLKIKWWKEKRGGGKCSTKSEDSEATPLDLQNVGGVFLVLFVGAILGIIGSFVECALRLYRKSERDQVSFKEELMKEMRFFIQFKQNVKEVDGTPHDSTSNKNLMSSTKSLDTVRIS
ncbi:glutamate receptor ionotropic, kainate 2 isoform X2 [Leptinotarsa decemlineata]